MTKTKILKTIQLVHKSAFIKRSELAAAMGFEDPHHVDKYLKGLPKIGSRYSLIDVAERIAEIG